MKRNVASFPGLNLLSQFVIVVFSSLGLPSMSIAATSVADYSGDYFGNYSGNYSADYYASVSDARFSTSVDTEFRGQLHDLVVKGHHPLPDYTTARHVLFGQLHLQQMADGTYFIHDVYCQKDYTAADFTGGRGPAPGQAPDDRVLNLEHTWPQSHFSQGDGATEKVDLHHLYPAYSKLNGIRGNFDFGDLDPAVPKLVCNTAQIGQTPDGRTVFDPPDAQKGHIARALFYFAVRYGLPIEDHEEASLRVWNKMMPPDAFEIYRNNEIEKIQGNRNPFIDHPEYADQIANF